MSAAAALAAIGRAARDPGAVADRVRGAGGRIVWTLGADIPRELIDAFGLHPVRLVPDLATDTAAIDALIGGDNLGVRGRALLAAIARIPTGDALLISHADSELPQLFATLRELVRCGAMPRPEVAFLDLLTIDRPATRQYNRVRVEQVARWLSRLADSGPDFAGAIANGNALRDAARALTGLSGVQAHELAAATAILPVDECLDLIGQVAVGAVPRPASTGLTVVLSGSAIEDLAIVDAIEAAGALIVGETHAWGRRRFARRLLLGDPLDAFAASALAPASGPFAHAADHVAALAQELATTQPERLLHLRVQGEESAPWHWHAVRDRDASAVQVSLPDQLADLATIIATGVAPVREVAAATDDAPRPRPAPPARSRKSLDAVARLGAYQRGWFAGIREQAARGVPIAAVNANAPQETLRAMGIPFVVNQWWASIVAAKQQSARYAALLEANGLPGAVEAYSAQGVAAAFDHDDALAPWGGLPTPALLEQAGGTDATTPLFDAWQAATGAHLVTFQRSIESRWDIPVEWWDDLPERWDEVIEPERLDLLEAELRQSIVEVAEAAGHAFDVERFEDILTLVNEQQGYYRRTRDLVATTVPAPIGLADSMPATMVPQWHRGTEWARDAARDFHDEVAARVAAGEAACPNERIRLMFVGRGIWSDMSFYQRWEASHGAVFVWSMYLALAADGYIRRHDRGRDPMRALAARFVTMGDELRMPTWAGAWHVKEARFHQCDGAVALSDADPLVLRALREAGYPVLELGLDNFARDPDADAAVAARMTAFLDGPVAAAAARRA